MSQCSNHYSDVDNDDINLDLNESEKDRNESFGISENWNEEEMKKSSNLNHFQSDYEVGNSNYERNIVCSLIVISTAINEERSKRKMNKMPKVRSVSRERKESLKFN